MRKGDLYIGLIILLIMGLLGLGYKLYLNSLGSERFVVIKVDGDVRERIKLTKTTNEVFTVLTEKGKFISISEGEITDTKYDYNIIHIYDGGVRVTDADCPNKEDVKMGFVKIPGKPIICVPHHLEVIIEGGSSDTPEIDGGTN